MALQWTPLRLMMTGGDSRVIKHHRTTSELLLELKRRTPQPLMHDKAVQSTDMDDDIDIVTTSANDNVTSANDNVVSSVTVAEINSPTEDEASSRPLQRATTHCSEDSGLVSDEGFGAHLEDAVDTATLQLRPTKHNIDCGKDETEDEIKEQSPPPPPLLANNCKLRDQFEDDKLPDYDNNCALDCLAFTLECCQCVVL
ncbi:hypothetical protein LSTR_LSTR014590 [Laodelphax striatellus]|uniref:Uncharacterized protein n=1 Tax=Laodelphax striatellus TaxID=195883 RepID=A0A482X3J6_LAOST|nr:hypothetical protein LSTR_LSTR014590 [Laodelphax striatellus]